MGELIAETGQAVSGVAPAAVMDPTQLLVLATQSGASVEVLERLMALQERWSAAEARRAFSTALLEFKRNPPKIVKTKQVAIPNGPTFKHAVLDEIVAAVTEPMSAQGLSFRWEVSQASELITVRCLLSHVQGHSVVTELSATPDGSGKKNAIQSVASTVTYLQRYTLLAALGLAAGDDDDAQKAGGPAPETLTEEEVMNLKAMLEEQGADAQARFLAWARCKSLSEILRSNYKECVRVIEKRRRNMTPADSQKVSA